MLAFAFAAMSAGNNTLRVFVGAVPAAVCCPCAKDVNDASDIATKKAATTTMLGKLILTAPVRTSDI
jgi:hypothetical protein